MNRATRLQTILDICCDIFNSGKFITLDEIYKKLDSKIPKTTISKDLKFMKPFLEPKGKRWILTHEGKEASKKGDVFKFTLMEPCPQSSKK